MKTIAKYLITILLVSVSVSAEGQGYDFSKEVINGIEMCKKYTHEELVSAWGAPDSIVHISANYLGYHDIGYMYEGKVMKLSSDGTYYAVPKTDEFCFLIENDKLIFDAFFIDTDKFVFNDFIRVGDRSCGEGKGDGRFMEGLSCGPLFILVSR